MKCFNFKSKKENNTEEIQLNSVQIENVESSSQPAPEETPNVECQVEGLLNNILYLFYFNSNVNAQFKKHLFYVLKQIYKLYVMVNK